MGNGSRYLPLLILLAALAAAWFATYHYRLVAPQARDLDAYTVPLGSA